MRGSLLILALLASHAQADPASTSALNALRSDAGQSPVAFSDVLARAAIVHAQDMLRAGFFSHSGSDGSSVGDRVKKAGYRWCVVAENIAQGQRGLSEVMSDWAASPDHNRNMLWPDVTEFALVQGEGAIWVMVLARPGC